MFGAYMTTEAIERATVRYIHDMGWKRIGMLATTDTSGQVGVRGYQRAINGHEKGYATIVALERFNPDDVSVAAQVAKIKAANPQVIIAFAAGAPFGTILRGLRDAGLDLPVDTSSANTTPTALARYAQILPTTLIVNGSLYDGRKLLPPGPPEGCVRRAGNGFAHRQRRHARRNRTPDLGCCAARRQRTARTTGRCNSRAVARIISRNCTALPASTASTTSGVATSTDSPTHRSSSRAGIRSRS